MQNEKSRRRLAVVTGASTGIGYELAKAFARNGFDLLVASEDAGITDAANAFRALGTDVETVRTDLSTYEGVDVLARKINERRELGHRLEAITITSVTPSGGDFISTNLHDEIRMINLTVISAVHLTKHVLPHFLDQGRGRILFTSSLAAHSPGRRLAVYTASNAFVQSFAEALRSEVKDCGVSVTSLHARRDEDVSEFAHKAFDEMMQGQAPDLTETAKSGGNGGAKSVSN